MDRKATRRLATIVLLAVIASVIAGCADKTVSLSYAPRPSATALRTPLLIVPFNDRRGNEGDHGDRFRVGGIYGGYGNRLAKIMVATPWPDTLQAALVAEFRAQGIDARSSSPVSVKVVRPAMTPGAAKPDDNRPATAQLEGEVRNFSTEARWSRQAHISAIVRLRDAGGRVLAEKKIEARETGGIGSFDEKALQELLNRAFAGFVHTVATDAEILALLR